MHPFTRALMSQPAGRPKTNIRPFILKPTDRLPSGAEYINTMPPTVKAVHEKFLSGHKLPPALAPSYIRRPEVMEKGRAAAISKGWRNPRSRAK